MYAIEITAAIDSSGNTQVFYISDGNFITDSTDTPPHVAFDTILISQGNIGRHVYSDGRTGGKTKLEVGEVILSNIDGGADGWVDYSFDGRRIKIYKSDGGTDYPSDFMPVFTGTMDGIELYFDKAIIRIRDKSYLFDVPISSSSYLGNNSLPDGLEGTEDDIKGQKKPVCYGTVFNISPVLVNTSRLIYQVNDGVINSVDAVYDRMSALTKGTDYTSISDMETNAPSAGYYRTLPGYGYFRLGSSPAGKITADVTQGATTADRTVGQILNSIALRSSLQASEISSSDVSALDSLCSYVVGIYCIDDTVLSAMDSIAESINAWYGFDDEGILRMGRLDAPATSVLDIYDYDILGNIERRLQKDVAIPAWKISINHSKNYTVQTSDIAGSVSDATRSWCATEYRTEFSSNTNQDKWLLSQDFSVNTLLTSSTDAALEAARLLSLYGSRRDIIELSVDIATAVGVNLMDTITVYFDRFGMGAGKSFVVIGIYLKLESNTVTLSLWG